MQLILLLFCRALCDISNILVTCLQGIVQYLLPNGYLFLVHCSVLVTLWLLVYRALCDTRNMGKLTKDQFALALYLIQQKLKGVDPPARLPPEMVPPTTRRSSLVVISRFLYYTDFVGLRLLFCHSVCRHMPCYQLSYYY